MNFFAKRLLAASSRLGSLTFSSPLKPRWSKTVVSALLAGVAYTALPPQLKDKDTSKVNDPEVIPASELKRRTEDPHIQNDEPLTRDYEIKDYVACEMLYPSFMRWAMLAYMLAPVCGYSAIGYLLHRVKFGHLNVALAFAYLYYNAEKWIEFDLLITRLELLEDKEHALLTKSLFFPRTHKIRISETMQTMKYPQDFYRMNYFQTLNDKNELICFARFDYDGGKDDPMHFSNKGLFADICAGRVKEVSKYKFKPN